LTDAFVLRTYPQCQLPRIPSIPRHIAHPVTPPIARCFKNRARSRLSTPLPSPLVHTPLAFPIFPFCPIQSRFKPFTALLTSSHHTASTLPRPPLPPLFFVRIAGSARHCLHVQRSHRVPHIMQQIDTLQRVTDVATGPVSGCQLSARSMVRCPRRS
ncbi:hypothetical protein BD309DRAFT_1041139, partial [Dichomitus squalens]